MASNHHDCGNIRIQHDPTQPDSSQAAAHRYPISIRPTALQLAWLKAERERRGIALNALVLMALEQAMASTAQAPNPERPGNDNLCPMCGARPLADPYALSCEVCEAVESEAVRRLHDLGEIGAHEGGDGEANQ